MSLEVFKGLGAGTYGIVYHAKWEGRKVAIKKFPLTKGEVDQDTETGRAIRKEVAVLQQLADRHIIQFFGQAQHEDRFVLVMDYAECGSLDGAIMRKWVQDWPTKERIAQEIVRGLAYIHYKGVVHRDLKSKNVLLTRHMEVKLCDFGLAKVKTSSIAKSEEKTPAKTMGTFRWMAPELLGTNPVYSTKSDMYALGMVMWEMAANQTAPFGSQQNTDVVITMVKNGVRELLPDDTPGDYRDWVQRCWDQDPSRRPDASEMVAEDYYDVLDEMGSGGFMMSDSMSQSEATIRNNYNSSSGNNKHKTKSSPFLAYCGTKLIGDARRPSKDETQQLLIRANEGHVDAQMAVAAMYEKGHGVRQSALKAYEWYISAASKNCAEAQFKAGKCLYEGRGPQQDRSAAAVQLALAANQGHAGAQDALGWMYLNGGEGVEQDSDKAIEWLHKSAKQGYSAKTQRFLGAMYQNGQVVKQDHVEAVAWYRKAADKGDVEAHTCLGWMYYKGYGVDQNYDQALKCYLKAAEGNDAQAQYNIGYMYIYGHGVEKDESEAFSWVSKAANQWYVAAQNCLAWMYKSGKGIQKDTDEALKWYRNAATQDDAMAQDSLGWIYLDAKNYKEAEMWYRKAAEKGYAGAQYGLGLMYQNRQGCDPSVQDSTQEALKWYTLASEQGHKDATNALKTLEKK